MSYGSVIKRRREAMGLDTLALSERIGVSQERIRRWEKGEALPNLMHVPMLCAALDLPYDEFFNAGKKQKRRHRKYSYPYFQLSLAPILCNQTMNYYRRRKGMALEAFAAACAVTPETAARWEAGRAIPPLDKIPIICDTLGIQLWQFFE